MLGNMKLYLGPEHLNEYAKWLRVMARRPCPIACCYGWCASRWSWRLAAHSSRVELTLLNRRARPVAYSKRDYVAATYAARTMRWGGVIIILFVIYHCCI